MKMWVGLVAAALVLAPVSGFAQQMPSHDMMMHGTPLQGVVAAVRYVACGDTPQTCQGILEVVPSTENAAMHDTAMAGHMMMEHTVTIIVIPGAALMYRGSALPLTRVKPGDSVTLEYQTLDNMNIALSLTMTGMGSMGHM